MDSKKIIEKLIKIADSQQKMISKLAQTMADNDPMSGDLTPTPQAAPSAPSAPTNKATPYNKALLAPIGTKLTEDEWRALEQQRGMKPGESTDAVHPDWVKAPQHSQQAGTNAPATQGGPPKVAPKLTPTEQAYVDMLKKKNQNG